MVFLLGWNDLYMVFLFFNFKYLELVELQCIYLVDYEVCDKKDM